MNLAVLMMRTIAASTFVLCIALMSCDGIACCTCTVMCAVGISRTRVDAKRGVSQSDTLVALSVAPGVSRSSGPLASCASCRTVSSTTDSGRLVSVCRSPAVKEATVAKACRRRYCGRFTVRRMVVVSGVVGEALRVLEVLKVLALEVLEVLEAEVRQETGRTYSSVYSLRSKRNCSTRLEYLPWYSISNCSRSAASSGGNTTSFHWSASALSASHAPPTPPPFDTTWN